MLFQLVPRGNRSDMGYAEVSGLGHSLGVVRMESYLALHWIPTAHVTYPMRLPLQQATSTLHMHCMKHHTVSFTLQAHTNPYRLHSLINDAYIIPSTSRLVRCRIAFSLSSSSI